MQAANTLYASVHLQANKQALFVAFSFIQPVRTVAQRTAHYVATVHNKKATLAQIMQLLQVQQARDNAASVCLCNTDAISKMLNKNTLAAS